MTHSVLIILMCHSRVVKRQNQSRPTNQLQSTCKSLILNLISYSSIWLVRWYSNMKTNQSDAYELPQIQAQIIYSLCYRAYTF